KMDAEERKRGIRHRIDQRPAEPAGIRLELEILASERDDHHLWILSAQLGDAVGIEPGARNDPCGVHFAARRIQHDAAYARMHPRHLRLRKHLDASLLYVLRETARDAPVIRDPGLRHVDRLDAPNVRYDLPEPLGSDQFASYPILPAACIN